MMNSLELSKVSVQSEPYRQSGGLEGNIFLS